MKFLEDELAQWWRPGGPSLAKHPGRFPDSDPSARAAYNAAATAFVVHHASIAINSSRQLMLKESSNAATLARARALVEYITRKGTLPLRNEHGFLEDRDQWEETLEYWADVFREPPIDHNQPQPRNVGHFIISAPAGSDVLAFDAAVDEWLQSTFGENFNYLYAVHEDTDHPHVHIALHRNGHDGKALHVERDQIEKWRIDCATVCRAHGLSIDASRRYERGVTRHNIPQSIYHMIQRGEIVDDRVRDLSVNGNLNERERAHLARILHSADMHKLAAELYREQNASTKGRKDDDKHRLGPRLEDHADRLSEIAGVPVKTKNKRLDIER